METGMKKEEVVFVVLHYKVAEETKKCVNALRKYGCKIVIVCNGSNNGSDEEIEELFLNTELIIIKKNNSNLGFANGMNVGFACAKYELGAKLILCLNNDIIINEEEFIDLLCKKYEQSPFGVAGCDIVTPKGIHHNPYYINIPTLEGIEKEIQKCRKAKFRCTFLLGLGDIVYSALVHFDQHKKEMAFSSKKLLKLHGSALIFGEDYISKFDGLYPETFLYMEEDILTYVCYKNDIRMEYIPDIKVIHNVSASTRAVAKNVVDKHLFFYTNKLKSLYAFRKLVQDNSFNF